MFKVYCLDQDISKYISEIDQGIQTLGQPGQLVYNAFPALKGINTDNFWSNTFGAIDDLSGVTIKITLDDITVFDGYIKHLVNNADFTSDIELESTIQAAMEKGCIYVSDELETPAQAFSNICQQYLLPVNGGSIAASSAIYSLDNVYIRILLTRPTMSIGEVFQTLADIGIASIYNYNNELYFDVYDTSISPLSLMTVTDKEKFSKPVYTRVEKEKITGYDITTLQLHVQFNVTDGAKTLEGGPDANIQIVSAQAGVWIGERWINYLSTLQKQINFSLDATYGKVLPLGSYITIDNYLYKIVSQDQSSKLATGIIGVTQ